MDFRDSFQHELMALRALGREAAERNPALVPFLNTPGGDPAVERLLEGFAFLGGRLREKLDDEFPEITHGLFSLLWPNYLRPFPAASIIQYQPTGNVTGSATIPRGTPVQSVPVEGTSCTFQTVYDTEILPLRLTDQWFLERNGTPVLAVSFALTSGTLQTLPLSSLRFFFSGEETAALTLYLTLLRRVREIRFVLRDAQRNEHVTATLDPTAVSPVGFQEHEGLCPYPEQTGMGYRILQEYFSFPEKFLFVDINGLEKGLHREALYAFQNAAEFELHFVLRELPEAYEALKADNWQLFCTPVVNLFPFQAAPMSVAGARREYRITPAPHLPGHFSVYSVDRVSSWPEGGKENVVYENAVSFAGFDDHTDESPRYRLSVRPPLNGEEVETYISLETGAPEHILLELELTCTNRTLPRQLRVGDICLSADRNTTSAVPFVNITPVVAPLSPPLQKDTLWKLLSNMSPNYIALSDLPSLRAMLASQHFRAMHEHRCARELERTLQGIAAITSTVTDRIFRSIPVRGMQTRLTMDRSCFSCEGALYLFGSVLHEFFALYATANSFHQLLISSSQGGEYQWPAKQGSLAKQ